MRTFALPVAVVLALAGAQERKPAPPTPVVGTTVEVVQVDAVVVDAKGRYVTDLVASDFEIEEDGRKQPISNCTYVTPDSPPEERATTPLQVQLPPREAVRRTMAVVVDDLGLSFLSIARVRTTLNDFIDRQMLPGDLVAIVRTGAGMGSLQQFTGDRRMLHAAVDGIRFKLAGRGPSAAAFSMMAPRETDSSFSGPHGAGGGDSGGSAGAGAAGAAERAAAAFQAGTRRFEAARERDREIYLTTGSLGAIRFVLGGLLRMPGRKSIVLVSEGFPMYDESGDRSRVSDAVQTLVDLANRASVVIYSFDPRGLMTGSLAGPLGSGSVREMRAGMSSLATDTGGLLLADTNDLGGAITRILEDQRGYYLIGYTPEPAARADQKGAAYHRIKVVVRRPGLQVRSRRGFYPVSASPEKVEETDPVRRLVEAAQSPFSAPDLGLRLTALFERDKERGSFVRSLLHIDARGLTFTERPDGSREAELQLVILVFGGDGRAVDSAGRQHRLAVQADAFDAALQGGLVYSFEVPVARPGGYQVRAAVQDKATGRLGSASQYVEVPKVEKGRPVLSGIAMGGGTSEDASDPQTTAAVRRFRAGSMVTYAFFAYNAPPRLQVKPTVYRDNAPVYEPAPLPFDGAGQPDPSRLAIAGRLHLGPELEPGDYTLELAVSGSDGRGKPRAARQWIDFEIVGP